MADKYINKDLYEAITKFEKSEKAQDLYYSVMNSASGRKTADGGDETVRERILKAYGALFCEDTGLTMGDPAGVDDVADTADRLYIDSPGYDRDHWYRMKYHFPVIDEDNYDRFAALVISDLNSGPLHDAASNDGQMLVVGEKDPLSMTKDQRANQKIKSVRLSEGGDL